MVHTKLYIPHIVIQILLGTLTPIHAAGDHSGASG